MRRRLPLLLVLALLFLAVVWFITPERNSNLPEPNPKYQVESIGEQENPGMAARQNFEMTKDPALGYPPSQRKVEAFERIKQLRNNNTISDGAIPGVVWTERGSDNVGGRTRALMWDPNDSESKKLWAGAIGGGLWYLEDITDPTASWQNAPDIMDNLAISTIAYQPNNKNTFYLGTGLGFTDDIRGEGIWKSTDGGDTWNQIQSTAEDNAFQYVQKIQVTSVGTVLAGTLSGLRRSTNGGDTWQNTLSGRIADIEIASNGNIYASTGVNSSGNVYMSDNDGVSWSDVTPEGSGRRIELATAPSNPDVVYAVADGGSGDRDVQWFFRTSNGGSSWDRISIPNYLNGNCGLGTEFFTRGQAWFDLIISVHPENEDIIIAGGVDLHRSADGGQTWEPISYWTGSLCDEFVHADQHSMAFRPGFPNEAVFGNDGGIDYSTNVGDSENPDFERRVRGYNTMLYYAVAMANEAGSDIMLAGAQDNGTQRYDQPGINSTRQVEGGDGAYCFIDQNDSNIQISSYVFNVYNVSYNGGKSFQRISSDQGSGRFINPADYDDEQGILFSAGATSRIKRIQGIKNNPQNQENLAISIGGGQISTIKVSPNVSKRLYLGTGSGNIYRVDDTDQGSMISTQITGTMDGNPGQFVSSIDVGETDDHLLVTYSNYGVTSVYETTDGGVTWQSKEGNLPDIPVRWGIFNPENTNEVLLATELGVWSTDEFNTGSPTWEPSNSGLASVRTDMLKYRSADKLVAAATHGRGVFTSSVFASNPVASFKADRKVSYVGESIQFIDASQVTGDNFEWDFGDGNNSTDQNPTHTYDTPGQYTVSLAVSGGLNTTTKENYITILPSKSTPYLAADGGDFESNETDFASTSLLHEVNVWERGTPSGTLSEPSSGTNAWKTGLNTTLDDESFDYKSALYTPAFDLSDEAKDYTLKFNLSAETIGCNSITGLYIEYSLDGGKKWQILGSTDRSAGDRNWYNRGDNLDCSIDFDITEDKMAWAATNLDGDFNVPVQTKLNHLAGNNLVSFRIIAGVMTEGDDEGYGLDGFMIDDFEITVNEGTADFEAVTTRSIPFSDIQFNYTSQEATAYAWDFGDGNSSTDMNPVHRYDTPGTYTVSLSAAINGSDVTETKTDLVEIVAIKTLPYTLADGGDFESNQTDFRAENSSNSGWKLGVSEVSGKDGTTSGDFAWVTVPDDNQYVNWSRATLVSPFFSFEEDFLYTLEFKANFNFENEWDGFIVEYSLDEGTTWVKLNDNLESGWYNSNSDPGGVFNAGAPLFSNTTNGFETFSTDISFLYPNPAVSFRLNFKSDAGVRAPGAAIDDFQILAQGAVQPTASFTASTSGICVGETVTYTSTSEGTITRYEWNFGVGASPSTSLGEGPHEVTYSEAGTANVSLRVLNSFDQEDTQNQTGLVTITDTHTPTFTKENTDDWQVSRLVASAGDSYQWYFRNEVIEGATEQSYLTSENGLYAVEVTINGCTVRSIQQSIVTAIDEDNRTFERSVNVYPNPATDLIKVGLNNEVMGTHQISIIDASGATLMETERTKDSFEVVFEIDARSLIQGNYLIRIISPKGMAVKQVLKQ